MTGRKDIKALVKRTSARARIAVAQTRHKAGDWAQKARIRVSQTNWAAFPLATAPTVGHHRPPLQSQWVLAAGLLSFLGLATISFVITTLLAPYMMGPQPKVLAAPGPTPAQIATIEPLPKEQLIDRTSSDDGSSLLDTLTSLTVTSPQPVEKTVALDRGDTLMEALTDAGATRTDAHNAIAALKPIYNPRKLRAGQKIDLTFDPVADPAPDDEAGADAEPALRLASLTLQPDIERHVTVALDKEGDYRGTEIIRELREGFVQAKGTITSSLFLAADEASIPPAITIELIRMYSYGVDFQRDIQPGDGFEVFFSRKYDELGQPVKDGAISYASLSVGGKVMKLWRHDPGDGPWDYFDEKGQSMKKFLMKTPIDGARLSSGFGRRKHPVLGYTKMHTGVDFAAPRGTPIYAAGNGTVERASRYSSYGKYIRIRHANGYKTAYAHLNGYARGIKSGARVRQGQVIGYVGTTGRSTGPHLHYEIHVNGKKVNPRRIKVPTGRKLGGKALAAFRQAQARIDSQMAAAPTLTRFAEAQFGNAN